MARAFLGQSSLWLTDDLMPPVRYDVLYDEKGTRRLVRVDDLRGTVALVADDAVHARVCDHMSELGVINRDFECAATSDIEHVRKFIVAMAPGIDQETILPIASKTQAGLAYERLPFDLDADAPTPTWESILVRCSNALAIKAFIGSLLDPNSDRSQFLYIYGEGNEGKGSMIEALSTIFGSAHTNQITPKELRFWLASIYNKRLVTFSECDDFKFAVSEDMKAVTGNDTVSVDEKGQPVFKAKAICKFMFAANRKPRAQDTPAHKRRLIYSEIAPWVGESVPVKTFVGRLVAEMHPFLSECWRTYKKLCPNGERIPVDEDIFKSLVEENNADFEEILDEFFVVDTHLVCKARDIENVFIKQRLPITHKNAFLHFLKSKNIRYNNRYTGAKGTPREAQVAVKGYWGIAPKMAIVQTKQYNQFMSPEEWKKTLEGLHMLEPF